MRKNRFIGFGGVMVLLAVATAAAREEVPARTGMARIVEIAKGEDADLADVVFPETLVADRRDWTKDDVLAWREGFRGEIAAIEEFEVAAEGDEGVASWSEPEGTKAIRIRFTGTRWVVACPGAYLVGGGFLNRARGGSAARVALGVRPRTGGYGKGAWSFPYANGDAAACKNRMSIWLCKYGDLHTVGSNRIADAGKADLEEVCGLPVGLEFGRTLEPHSGHVYVLRCAYEAGDLRIDFYVKFRVLSVRVDGMEFEWDLLAAGPGAPVSIHESTLPPDDRSGADGCDGYCGGKQR